MCRSPVLVSSLLVTGLLAAGCAPGDDAPKGDASDDDTDTADDDSAPGDDDGTDDDGSPPTGDLWVLSEDATWGPGEGPVDLVGDLYVPPGIVLTLEAGATLRLYPEADVYVEGALVAEGSPGAPVSFERATAFRWGSVQIASESASSLEWIGVEGGSFFVRSGLDRVYGGSFENASITVYDGGEFTVEGCSFAVTEADSAHLNAVYAPEGGALHVLDTAVTGYRSGVLFYGTGAEGELLHLEDLEVEQATWMGVVVDDAELDADGLRVLEAAGSGLYATSVRGVVRGAYLAGNGSSGLYGGGASASLDLEGSDVTNNVGYGILGAGVVRGCYLAGNAGADAGELDVVLAPGVEDGVQDAYGTQQLDLDAIVDPADSPVTLGPG
ncbi:hypothetical protein L6R50_19440 [Myxococcota bacterium]|nr:hypothetical protein [Myxococcota bacterium]